MYFFASDATGTWYSILVVSEDKNLTPERQPALQNLVLCMCSGGREFDPPMVILPPLGPQSPPESGKTSEILPLAQGSCSKNLGSLGRIYKKVVK